MFRHGWMLSVSLQWLLLDVSIFSPLDVIFTPIQIVGKPNAKIFAKNKYFLPAHRNCFIIFSNPSLWISSFDLSAGRSFLFDVIIFYYDCHSSCKNWERCSETWYIPTKIKYRVVHIKYALWLQLSLGYWPHSTFHGEARSGWSNW